MSLRKQIIRLAYEHPEFRSDLLPLIQDENKQAEFDPEEIAEQVPGPLETEEPEIKKEFSQQEFSELQNLQESGNLGKAAADQSLRKAVIRLAHQHPEFRGDLLPLLKEAGCEKLPAGPMRENCEKKKAEGEKKDDKKDDK